MIQLVGISYSDGRMDAAARAPKLAGDISQSCLMCGSSLGSSSTGNKLPNRHRPDLRNVLVFMVNFGRECCSISPASVQLITAVLLAETKLTKE